MMSKAYRRPYSRALVDMTGRRAGKLVVISRAPIDPSRTGTRWIVQCSCGSPPRPMRADHIAVDRDQSCGCNRGKKNTTHGASNTPEYRVWHGMRERCANPKAKWFRNYGGRGIRVCDQWKTSFATFIADLGPRPSPRHTLERVDNDGNYEPSNCRWATRHEQMNNTRLTTRLTIDGVTRTVSEWACAVGISRKVLRNRIDMGWPVDSVLLSPPSHKKRRNRVGQQTARVT